MLICCCGDVWDLESGELGTRKLLEQVLKAFPEVKGVWQVNPKLVLQQHHPKMGDLKMELN